MENRFTELFSEFVLKGDMVLLFSFMLTWIVSLGKYHMLIV